MPSEFESNTDKLNNWLVDFAKPLLKNGSNTSEHFDPDKLQKKQIFFILDLKSNSKFCPLDIRIPSSELEKFKKSSAKISLINEVQSNPGTSKTRENQLHTLVDRILLDFPKIGTKQLWNLIELDFNKDEPIYDTENIIQKIDSACIEWKSRHNSEQVSKWSSFQSLVSKRRNK